MSHGKSSTAEEPAFLTIAPKILYFGTPVALVTSLNEDHSANLAPISSSWALGRTVAPPRVQPAARHLQNLGGGASVEAEVRRVHVRQDFVLQGNYIDPDKWQPLIYNFRHYFGLGEELGRTFRAEV